MSFISELKRRNVIRMAGLYIVGAWLIAQVAETLLPIFHTPDWVLQSLVVLLAIGFIPALVFAWVFELTPAGLKRDEDVVPENSIAPQTARRMERMIIAMFALALIFFAFDKFVLTPKREASLVADTSKVAVQKAVAKIDADRSKVNPSSIAVLPFADLSQAGDQSYFSDGMAEEILNVLAKVKGLQVASRTSSFAFKGQESMGIPAIAQQLSVRHVLEGSVRRSGGTIRITAQLIDAEVDRHLWSETYDRPLTTENVFAIQDEIAKAIATAMVESLKLKEVTTVKRAAPTSNLTAYDLYLQARALFQSRRLIDVADQLLVKSLELDPKFAKAWELRAGVQSLYNEFIINDVPAAERDRLAIEFAERALAIEPASALALAVKANIRSSIARKLRGSYDYASIISDLEHAHALEPQNGNMLNWLGIALTSVGQQERALQAFRRCMQVDPTLAACFENEYESLFALGRYDEAMAHFQKALDQGLITDQYVNFSLLAHFEEKSAFMLASNQSHWLPGWQRQEAIYQAYRQPQGNHKALVRDLLAFTDKHKRGGAYLSSLLIPLGAHDLVPFPVLIWGADYARYRQSAQFKAYIRKSGVYAYWRDHGFPPQCRATGKEDFICD